VRHAFGRVEATGLATARNVVPAHASRVCLRVGTSGKELAPNGKAAVKTLQALRRRQSESEPTRKQVARESGYGSPGGKALEGSSRDASGMKEGHEASGATANGEVQKASSEPRASRNRREGQEP